MDLTRGMCSMDLTRGMSLMDLTRGICSMDLTRGMCRRRVMCERLKLFAGVYTIPLQCLQTAHSASILTELEIIGIINKNIAIINIIIIIMTGATFQLN